MNQIVRSTVTGSQGDLNLRELQTKYECDSSQDEMEHLEPYGFTSEPFTDGKTDAINVYFDDEHNHGVVINVADRRYRITSMKSGEVAMYDDKNRHIYLKREGIEIDGVDDPITIKTTSDIKVECNNATVNCQNSATVTAPTVIVNGNVSINGNLSVSGTIRATGIISSSTDVQSGSKKFNSHTHGGVQSGSNSTGVPN